MRSLEKSGLSEPLIDRRSPRCSPKEGILQITIFALVGAPSRGGAARLVVLDREPEQLIGSPFDSCSRFIKSNSQSRARAAPGLGRLGRSSAALDGMPLSPAPSRSSLSSVIKTTEIGPIYISKKLPMFELI